MNKERCNGAGVSSQLTVPCSGFGSLMPERAHAEPGAAGSEFQLCEGVGAPGAGRLDGPGGAGQNEGG